MTGQVQLLLIIVPIKGTSYKRLTELTCRAEEKLAEVTQQAEKPVEKLVERKKGGFFSGFFGRKGSKRSQPPQQNVSYNPK